MYVYTGGTYSSARICTCKKRRRKAGWREGGRKEKKEGGKHMAYTYGVEPLICEYS
jgi:hypothetical protein